MTTATLNTLHRSAGILILATLCAASAPAQNRAEDQLQMVEIAKDVYTMVDPRGLSNSTFVVTPDGVLVFDTYILTSDQTLAAIRRTTDKKVRYLVSSHASGDHSTGGWYFREDHPTYIATRNQARDMFMQGLQEFNERKDSSDPRYAYYKGKELVQPDIAFTDSMTLYFGGLTFQLTAESTGHTNGDLTLYIPQRRVMLMGDLLDTEIHPGPGESAGVFFSQPARWIEVLDRIIARRLSVDTYVPGHGPVHLGRGVADLEEQRRYFVVMRNEVAKMIAAGKSLEEIQKEFQVPAEFSHYTGAGRLQNFLPLFYNQLIDRGL
jgi:glyoxylase-like metal-dependent hydrolase (beta-lactamase superfamily II)